MMRLVYIIAMSLTSLPGEKILVREGPETKQLTIRCHGPRRIVVRLIQYTSKLVDADNQRDRNKTHKARGYTTSATPRG
jgi:hypothetical protein